MIRNIIWKGLDSNSMEFCRIHFGERIHVKSSIVGFSEDFPFKADYEIELSGGWVISRIQLKTCLGNVEQSLDLKHDGHGKWFGDGKEWKSLEGCMDIDISVTPFTNSLPINRLKPAPGIKTDIDVVYIDILHFGITPERQHYTQLNKDTYLFSNDSGDFTANITVDSQKLVVHYPTLFDRLLIRD